MSLISPAAHLDSLNRPRILAPDEVGRGQRSFGLRLASMSELPTMPIEEADPKTYQPSSDDVDDRLVPSTLDAAEVTPVSPGGPSMKDMLKPGGTRGMGEPGLDPGARSADASVIGDFGIADVVDMPLQAIGGVRDAGTAMLGFLDWAGDNLAAAAASVGLEDPVVATRLASERNMPELPEVSAPRGPVSGLTRGVAQFLVGFGVAGKVMGAVGKGSTLRSVVQGGLSSFFAFEPEQERLSNLVQEFPELQNPVTEFLAASPDDGEIEGRTKAALEGLGLGAVTEGFVRSLRAIRAWRSAKVRLPADMAQRAAAAAKLGQGPSPPARDLMLLGSDDAPLVGKPDELVTKLNRGMEETGALFSEGGGVPADTIAKSLTAKGLTPLGNGEVYVNFARINAPEDIQKVIQDGASAFKESLDDAARGVRSHATTRASAVEIDAFDTLMQRRAGQPLNAEQSVAARELWVASAAKLQQVAAEAAASPSMENLFQLRSMLAKFHAVQTEVIGARTETARALNAWRIPVGGPQIRMDQMQRLLNVYGGSDVGREFAKKIAGLNGDPAALSAFVEKGLYAKTRDGVQEYWINAILSGPRTHITNMMSNALTASLNIFETAGAARLGRLLGREDAVLAGEAMANANGMIMSMKDALRNAAKTAITGESGFYTSGKFLEGAREQAISSAALGIRSNSWLGRAVDGIGAVVNIPGRALQTEDEFFKTIGYRGSLWQQAYRQATKEVEAGTLPATGIKARMAEIISAPTEEMSLAATSQAAYQTFTSDVGPLIQKLNAIRAEYPMLRFVIPFINTPTNIFKFTFERTPIAPLTTRYRAAIAQGGPAADLARTKMALGTAAIMLAMDLSMNGQITGGGPSSSSELANLKRQGWQAYSVKIGDRYYSFNRMDPLGTLLGFGGDLGEYLANADTDDVDEFGRGETDRAIAAAAFAVTEQVTSKTYMQGLSDLSEAINDPERFGAQWVKKMGASLVPAAVGQPARALDPVQRYTTGVIEEMKARLPGFSDTLPPRRDAWGREISYQSGLGPAYDLFSPIYGSEYRPEPIDREMQKDGWHIGLPQNAFVINGERVSLRGRPEIYSRYLEIRGTVKPSAMGEEGKTLIERYGDRVLLDTLNDVVTGEDRRSPAYRKLPDAEAREKYIDKIVGDYQRAAKAAVFREFPEIEGEAAKRLDRKRNPGGAPVAEEAPER